MNALDLALMDLKSVDTLLLLDFDPSEILSTADAFGRMASEHPEAEPEPLRKTATVLRALAVEVAEEYDEGERR